MLITQILGIGRNYAEHAKEQGADIPTRPMVFSKNIASLCGDGDVIRIPKVCQEKPQVDFEGELGVMIGSKPDGSPVKDVSLAEALLCVESYCVANDVSARWWQKEGGGGQFYRGKSFDTFCPIGAVVSASKVRDPQSLRLVTRVNGQTMQDGNTRDMIFSVATLIHELSKDHTLVSGTLILTGTPSGVGFARNPPIFLKAGDVVEIEIESVGKISNRVENA